MTAPAAGLTDTQKRRQQRMDALSQRIADHRTVRKVSRAEIADVIGLLVLGLVGLSGMATAFGGTRYLLVGGLGLVVSMGLAWLFARKDLPLWALTLAIVAIYLIVAPSLVVPGSSFELVVPSISTSRSLLTGAVQGWANILATTVPVGSAQNLLVLPLASGLVVGSVSMSIARRAPRAYLAAAIAPFVLLVAGILVGTSAPAWALQATCFVLVLLVWGSVRQRDARAAGMPTGRRNRWVGVIGVLAVAGVLGYAIGSWSMVVGSPTQRTVARDNVEPPVDLRDVPSPLEAFRSYRADDRADDVVFKVSGLEKGDRLRLATLDHYDGIVWHVRGGDTSPDSSSLFKRVGEEVPSEGNGSARSLTIEVGDYDGAWLPTPGPIRSVTFLGRESQELSEEFRYNLATDTAAVPTGLKAGERVQLDVVVPSDQKDLRDGDPDRTIPTTNPASVAAVNTRAAEFAATVKGSPLAKLRGIEARLRSQKGGSWPKDDRGYFSNGGEDEERYPGEAVVLGGHSAQRMRTMLDPKGHMVGNEEQYASAMALIAEYLGFRSRVVVGFKPEVTESGATAVKASDITAWTEVAVEGKGWVPLFPTPTDTNVPKDESTEVPPPQRLFPDPPEEAEVFAEQRTVGGGDGTGSADSSSGSPVEVPGWVKAAGVVVLPPLLIVGGVTLLMASLKARRRKRRRTRGAPGDRVAAGWLEVCDTAVDLGDVVPVGSTRRETAVVLARPGVAPLAQAADAYLFAPEPLDDAAAERYWREVVVAREAMRAPMSRFDRWKALVNPTSLRRTGRHTSAVAPRVSKLPAPPSSGIAPAPGMGG